MGKEQMKQLTRDKLELTSVPNAAYVINVDTVSGSETHVVVGDYSMAVELRTKLFESDVYDADLADFEISIAEGLWGYTEKNV